MQTLFVVTGICASLTIAGAALRRPVRWLFRKNVAEPVTGWLDTRVSIALQPVTVRLDGIDAQINLNGSGPMKQVVLDTAAKVDALAEKVGAIHLDIAANSAITSVIHDDTRPGGTEAQP